MTQTYDSSTQKDERACVKNTKYSKGMSDETVGQRLRLLLAQLNLDVKTFCRTLDVSETTVRNYFNRGNNPNAEFLTKLISSFPSVNLGWLLTGQGEPLTGRDNSTIAQTGNNFSNFVGVNHGKSTSLVVGAPNTGAAPDADVQAQLSAALAEVQSLRQQLDLSTALVAAKEETIAFMRNTMRNQN